MTGWPIDDREDVEGEADSLYRHLEQSILPLYYRQPLQWQTIMRSSIALNGSFFNTQRMIEQYTLNAYFPEKQVSTAATELEPALAK